jgi:hypothetical protein
MIISDFEENMTDAKRRLIQASERTRAGKKNIFNVAAAHAEKNRDKVKMPTFSFSEDKKQK